jgi:hypothetical protein
LLYLQGCFEEGDPVSAVSGFAKFFSLESKLGQCYKTFLSVIYGFSFVPGKLFQPILMFVGEARSDKEALS